MISSIVPSLVLGGRPYSPSGSSSKAALVNLFVATRIPVLRVAELSLARPAVVPREAVPCLAVAQRFPYAATHGWVLAVSTVTRPHPTAPGSP